MKKRKILFAAGCTVLILIACISCKSAPKPEDDSPDQSVQTIDVEDQELKEIDSALKALVERVESLRSSCEQYRIGAYYPEDWSEAESLRSKGNAAVARVVKKSADGVISYISADDYTEATDALTGAASLYEKILDGGLERLALDLAAEMAREREAAIAAGARSYYPEQFHLAETAEKNAYSLHEQNDVKGSYDAAQLALLRYKTLQRAMEAIALRKTIEENDFVQYDPDSYQMAGVKFDEAANAYGTEDAVSFDAANESVLLYRKVNNAGFQVLSRDMRLKAIQVRELCDSIKASRSMAAAYTEAAGTFARADAYGNADEWESAYHSYADAAVLFTDVFQQSSLKKNEADLAMEAARVRQEYSSKLARRADELAPLPEGAEGFSDVDSDETDVDESVEMDVVEPADDTENSDETVYPDDSETEESGEDAGEEE